ncbi:bifunctional hydroxymethylpyrimidine kinase/phosphomethylpyrimidine kinase [Prauserella marina]|uniref:Hydroxymethylpyrimidine/phosphomethylpyrimidine kinase n=1 Tax=Prauserella marina TaxID=530584 RepID=A0A222VWH6_9PSEU|nr:bifunctional hydroxymethylpyrimidine kinase/phosphomethylpyrimidine kinase [Prauserella marina]ASR38255.1 bifunctional hydroxymethylpyrimidine kinase/phosphomethylpyrimidine kinase [Prauserella marina]PWV78550.1 hydroxymethylpyrimidine/phosphomethylpyrimidine kinase [Prauserella marina]SDC88529.1 hydroxymethylpyrimidine/phosphomethylpyrimidine kinase [Prauserella marina]
MTATPKTALTIAGSDSGGGAGIQADLRTFFACGVHGMTAITAVTVQNSLGVQGFTDIPSDVVAAQIKAVAGDMGVDAAKTGMLATAEIIRTVAKTLDEVHIGGAEGAPFVVDPVAASMHGDALLREEALEAIRTELFPRATLVTPNLDEVRLLTGVEVKGPESQREAARALLTFGPQWVLVKGGHLYDSPRCVDLLSDGARFIELEGPRHPTEHTHGGGDTMASAITASLAKGLGVPDAVAEGKRFIERAVEESYPLGEGVGPVSPFWRLADGD